MEQYIPKSAVVAEIERRKYQFISQAESFRKIGKEDKESYFAALASNMNSLSCFLDTFEVKEANSVWHDAIELPDETSLILLSLKDGNFILADEKTAYIKELVDKWCYISDI